MIRTREVTKVRAKEHLCYWDAYLVDGSFKSEIIIKIDGYWNLGESQKGKGRNVLPKKLVTNFHVGKGQLNLDLYGLLGRY